MFAHADHYWTVVVAGLTPLVLWASWIDYKERRVPNYLNLLIVLTGLAAQMVFNSWSGLAGGVEGMFLGLGLLIIPWAMHMMGAGDVKLLAGIGAWMGPEAVLWSFLIGAIIGGVASLVMIWMKGRWVGAWQNFQLAAVKCTDVKMAFSEVGSVKSLGSNCQLIPYGVPLTAGTLIVMILKYLTVW
ncbi:MAG: A24 family peptidase [Phycisphaerae bacterium]